MEVYNKDKTKVLSDYDLSLGKLVNDTLTIHHNKVEEIKEQGHYETIKEYPNGGKDVEWVIDVKGVIGKEAYDEVKEILVYIPYTENELNAINLNKLRSLRAPLLQAFDKYRSAVTYGIVTESETEHTKIINWYNSILDLKNLDLEQVPEKIKYYL